MIEQMRFEMNPRVSLDEDGNFTEIWTDGEGIWHRIDGPAYRKYNADGIIIAERYYVHNRLFRLDGPAVQEFDDTGKLINQSWWPRNIFERDGKMITTSGICV